MLCDDTPEGSFGLEALFLRYAATACGGYCSESDRDFLFRRAQMKSDRIIGESMQDMIIVNTLEELR